MFFCCIMLLIVLYKAIQIPTQSLTEMCTKGQLISECLFEKIVWTKIPTKNLIDSAQQV